jgi:hypothetical protein
MVSLRTLLLANLLAVPARFFSVLLATFATGIWLAVVNFQHGGIKMPNEKFKGDANSEKWLNKAKGNDSRAGQKRSKCLLTFDGVRASVERRDEA